MNFALAQQAGDPEQPQADRQKLPVAIVGASGYTGAELVRLLARHPGVRIQALGGERQAGKQIGEVFPHLGALALPALCRAQEIDWSAIRTAFCCLPHGMSQAFIRDLPDHVRVIDVSADFRLHDLDLYRQVYGKPHEAPEQQRQACYGLTEWNRERIRHSPIVACPGCYPTAALLPLLPLMGQGLIDETDLIIDAASGTSGAGRDPRQSTLLAEASGKFSPYSVGTHRHAPEIEQELSAVADRLVQVVFTPYLASMVRGILATVHVRLQPGVQGADLRARLETCYRDEAFVQLVAEGDCPSTGHTLGSNLARLAVFPARHPDRAILFCAIDNLLKGASGQAVQNLNLQQDWPETTGLDTIGLCP